MAKIPKCKVCKRPISAHNYKIIIYRYDEKGDPIKGETIYADTVNTHDGFLYFSDGDNRITGGLNFSDISKWMIEEINRRGN